MGGIDLEQQTEEYLKRFLFYKPYPQQLEFHQAGLNAKERLFLAANRFGKTYACCIEVCMHLTGLYPEWWEGYRHEEPVNVWAVSLSREATRDILQKKYYLGDSSAGKHGMIGRDLIIKKSYGGGVPDFVDTVHVKHSSGGISTLSFKSFDQGREKFQGTERHIIHIDEEPPYDVYQECLMRTLSTQANFHGMMILSMVPLKGVTEMVLYFTDNRLMGIPSQGKFFMGGTWQDVTHMSKNEMDMLAASMRPHEREARTRGIPVLGSGMIYPVTESELICQPFDIPKHFARSYAIDFGWTAPTAVIFAAYDRDNDTLYLCDEYGDTEKSPQHHASIIWARGGDWMRGVYDPAGKISSINDGRDVVSLYIEAGLYLYPADNAKEEGIMKVLQRMQKGRLKIFSTMTQTLRELRMYARNLEGIPVKGNDHFMDCMRYLCMSGIGISSTHTECAYETAPRWQEAGYLN